MFVFLLFCPRIGRSAQTSLSFFHNLQGPLQLARKKSGNQHFLVGSNQCAVTLYLQTTKLGTLPQIIVFSTFWVVVFTFWKWGLKNNSHSEILSRCSALVFRSHTRALAACLPHLETYLDYYLTIPAKSNAKKCVFSWIPWDSTLLHTYSLRLQGNLGPRTIQYWFIKQSNTPRGVLILHESVASQQPRPCHWIICRSLFSIVAPSDCGFTAVAFLTKSPKERLAPLGKSWKTQTGGMWHK